MPQTMDIAVLLLLFIYVFMCVCLLLYVFTVTQNCMCFEFFASIELIRLVLNNFIYSILTHA